MAYVYISESSRRVSKISEEEMDKRWAAAFGPAKKQTCDKCGKEAAITVDGLCDECRHNQKYLCVDKHCVSCRRQEQNRNDLGLCDTCAAQQIEDGEMNHGA